MRGALSGDLSRSLPAAESTETEQCAFDGKHDRGRFGITELRDYGAADDFCNQSCRYKQDTENGGLWKQRIGKGLLWSGKRSLEIYMVHGLVLNVLMSKTKPEFPSIAGYGIVIGNFSITLVLCVVLIGLLAQSNMLKKLLGMK